MLGSDHLSPKGKIAYRVLSTATIASMVATACAEAKKTPVSIENNLHYPQIQAICGVLGGYLTENYSSDTVAQYSGPFGDQCTSSFGGLNNPSVCSTPENTKSYVIEAVDNIFGNSDLEPINNSNAAGFIPLGLDSALKACKVNGN